MWFGKYSRLEKIIIIGHKTGLNALNVIDYVNEGGGIYWCNFLFFNPCLILGGLPIYIYINTL